MTDMRYFILVKKKGSARYTGAIPTKRGATVSKIKAMLRKNLTRRYTAKIVSERQLKGMLSRLKKRTKRRRR